MHRTQTDRFIRLRKHGLWLVVGICVTPLPAVFLLVAWAIRPEIVNGWLAMLALAAGWLLWSFAVAYTTPRHGFDKTTFALCIVFFPVLYPACLLLLLGTVSMRDRMLPMSDQEKREDLT